MFVLPFLLGNGAKTIENSVCFLYIIIILESQAIREHEVPEIFEATVLDEPVFAPVLGRDVGGVWGIS